MVGNISSENHPGRKNNEKKGAEGWRGGGKEEKEGGRPLRRRVEPLMGERPRAGVGLSSSVRRKSHLHCPCFPTSFAT